MGVATSQCVRLPGVQSSGHQGCLSDFERHDSPVLQRHHKTAQLQHWRSLTTVTASATASNKLFWWLHAQVQASTAVAFSTAAKG